MPRTGSSYLRRAIRLYICNGCEDCNINEPFNNENFDVVDDKELYYKNLSYKIQNQKNVVIKTHYYQLLNLKKQYVNFYNDYIKTDFTNILLLRKNFFEVTLSNAIAKKTSIWGDDAKPAVCAIITENDLISSMNWYSHLWKIAAENPLKLKYNHIMYYEDFTFLPDVDYSNLSNENVGHVADNITVPSYDKRKVVQNYDELKKISSDFLKNFSHDGLNIEDGIITLK